MPSIVLILVIIAAALAMASGIWVATALIRTLTRNRTTSGHNPAYLNYFRGRGG